MVCILLRLPNSAGRDPSRWLPLKFLNANIDHENYHQILKKFKIMDAEKLKQNWEENFNCRLTGSEGVPNNQLKLEQVQRNYFQRGPWKRVTQSASIQIRWILTWKKKYWHETYSVSRLIMCPSSRGILPLKQFDERFLQGPGSFTLSITYRKTCNKSRMCKASESLLTDKSDCPDCANPKGLIHLSDYHAHCFRNISKNHKQKIKSIGKKVKSETTNI